MENRWNAIVRNLLKSKSKDVDEDTYQDTIENQLQLLGWLDGIESRPSLPIGAAKSIIPDIVLNKDNHRVLPIEIKRPKNVLKVRQASQLSSYMRVLRLPVGMYIGENIHLYYDTPDDNEGPISVCTIDFEENNPLGRKICNLLAYDNFDVKTLEDFCIEQLRMKKARNNFRKRIQEYISPQTASQNISELLKEKFLAEGFDSAIIDVELKKLNIKVDYNVENPLNSINKQITPNAKIDITPSPKAITSKQQEHYNDNNTFIKINENKGIEAKAIYKDGKMIVLKGSTFTSNVEKSFNKKDLRDLVISKSVKLPNGHYRLLEDFCFDSPSAAAVIVCGTSINGLTFWKTEEGKTLKESMEHNN